MPATGRGPVIAVADLRRALEKVLDQVVMDHGELVDLDAVNYWSLRLKASFNFQEPVDFDVRSLDDDAETMREMLQRDPDEVYVWHNLELLVGILRRLAALDLPSRD